MIRYSSLTCSYNLLFYIPAVHKEISITFDQRKTFQRISYTFKLGFRQKVSDFIALFIIGCLFWNSLEPLLSTNLNEIDTVYNALHDILFTKIIFKIRVPIRIYHKMSDRITITPILLRKMMHQDY